MAASLQLLLLLLCCCVAPLAAAASNSIYRLSTLRPDSSGQAVVWADEWSMDLSLASPDGTVQAEVLSRGFLDWTVPPAAVDRLDGAVGPLPFRTDTSVRVHGLESLYLFHHEASVPGMQFYRFSEETNSSTFEYPARDMASTFSCSAHDEVMDLTYIVSSTSVEGGSNVWNVSLWFVGTDEYELYSLVWSTLLMASDPLGADPEGEAMAPSCTFNDRQATLYIHFPTPAATASPSSKFGQGQLLVLKIVAALNWNIQATLVDQISWPDTQPQQQSDMSVQEAMRRIDAANGAAASSLSSSSPQTLSTRVLGLASDRVDSGLVGFAVASSDSSGSSWVGLLDPASGVEVLSMVVPDLSSYVAPLVVFHRDAHQLLVVEWAQPWRYTALTNRSGQVSLTSGVIQFADEQLYTLLGLYPMDGCTLS